MVTEAQQTKIDVDAAFVEMVAEGWAVACTVRTTPISSSDLVAGTITEGADSDTSANCVLTAINDRNAPNAVIEVGDKLATVDTEVSPQAVIIIDSVEWTVIDVFDVQPGATFMISKAQIRR